MGFFSSDLAAHAAILSDASLRVLHICARNSSEESLRLSSTKCNSAANGGPSVLHEKRVSLDSRAQRRYLAMLQGRASSAEQLPLCEQGRGGMSPYDLLALVVRFDDARHERICQAAVRNATSSSYFLTSSHEQAVYASQSLLNANSLAILRSSSFDFAACERVAAALRHDLSAAATAAAATAGTTAGTTASQPVRLPAPPSSSAAAATATSATPRPLTAPLLPDGLLVDAGAVMELLGLRANKLGKPHVSLIYAANETAGPRLLRACSAAAAAGSHPAADACVARYLSHNPPGSYFEFHGMRRPEQLVRDPAAHAFCFGLKFVAPAQLCRYKEARFQRWHWAHDRSDAQSLRGWMLEQQKAAQGPSRSTKAR